RTGEVRWEDDKIDQKLAAIKGLSQSRAEGAKKAQPFVFNINGQGRVVIRGGRNIVVRGGAAVAQPAAPAALPDHLISVSDVVVAVADHNGRVIVFSADHGKVRWQSAAGLRRVSHIRTDGRHVVLAGLDANSIPLVYVYDAQTGQLIHRLSKAKRQVVQWLGISEEGLLIYVSPMQIEAFDLTRGQARWICEPQVHLTGGRTTWLGSGRLVTRSREGDLLWVDLADGNVVGRLPVRDLVADPMRVEADGQRWFVSGANRCLAVTDAGVPLWQDAITDGGKVVDQRLTERYVLLLTRPAAEDGVEVHRRRIYLLDRTGGAIRYQQSLDPGETFDSVHLLDGRLLLSGEASTAVLAGN
ncbi:MAG: PQQ-binding-like beta-propeller repeat protein, partial [Phycisphaerae bacterium]|nr:PQQ-binding-like beta-propeller repeat protein [Phycisphaerae bacterium]